MKYLRLFDTFPRTSFNLCSHNKIHIICFFGLENIFNYYFLRLYFSSINYFSTVVLWRWKFCTQNNSIINLKKTKLFFIFVKSYKLVRITITSHPFTKMTITPTIILISDHQTQWNRTFLANGYRSFFNKIHHSIQSSYIFDFLHFLLR